MLVPYNPSPAGNPSPVQAPQLAGGASCQVYRKTHSKMRAGPMMRLLAARFWGLFHGVPMTIKDNRLGAARFSKMAFGAWPRPVG